MRNTALFLGLLVTAVLLANVDRSRRASRGPALEGCLACHAEVTDPGPAHPVSVLGCSPCHGGNPDSRDRRRAHQGLVDNPGDLAVTDRTCGRSGCHARQVARVDESVMTTNAGIRSALRRLWDKGGPGASPAMADDYYAKLCATCHLRRPRDAALGEAGLRGGCGGCHVVREAGAKSPDLARLEHPLLSMRVPMANCVRCHNRSARIGLTYQGRLEDDGYGAPHAKGGPGPRRLSGSRHWLAIPPDVHFAAGMVCIDCHTGNEVMGDGTPHATLRSQLETACEDCHRPRLDDGAEPPPEAVRLAMLNTVVPPLADGRVARTGRGTPLYALRVTPSGHGPPRRAVLYRKLDGRPLEMELMVELERGPEPGHKPHHALPGHERLGCQACHSPFMPQCFGCHVVLRLDGRQIDRVRGVETPGRWTEARSYTRFRRPPLGLDGNGRVMPFSPCQVLVSVFGPDGGYDAGASLGAALMTAFDPHSTQLASRTCLDCHLDPRTLGLGSGRLARDAGPGATPDTRPLYDAAASNFGWNAPPDRMTGPDGRPEQGTAAGGRPLDAGELRRVLDVAPCLPCHGDYDDPLWRGYGEKRRQWRAGQAEGCALAAPSEPGGSVQCDTSSRDRLSTMTAGFGRSWPGPQERSCNMLE